MLLAIIFISVSAPVAVMAQISITDKRPVMRESALGAMALKSQAQADSVIVNFWNRLDLSNEDESLDPDIIEQQMKNFFSLFPAGKEASIEKGIANFLDKASANDEVYGWVYEIAGELLDTPSSRFRNEEYLIPFLTDASKSAALSEADRERAKYRLEVAMKNRCGTKATDFAFSTREGRSAKLSTSLKKGNNLLIFYDPDCAHCMETIEKIKDAGLPSSVNVVAVYPGEDRQLWEATAKELPKEWTVACASDPIIDEEWYVIPEMPGIYLLDSAATVILKDPALPVLLSTLRTR